MNALSRVAGWVGIQHLRATVTAVAAVLLLAGGGLFLGAVTPNAPAWLPGVTEGLVRVEVAGDSDGDGLPDAVENRVGSDVADGDTLGKGVPDGWLFAWYGEAVDWQDSLLLDAQALAPPPGALPAALAGPALPLPTVADLYQRGQDEARKAGLVGAWWLERPGLDPRRWDNNDDGIADAWLFHYGLDPMATAADAASPGSPDMTIRAKYEAGLDPTRDDSDGDGLADAAELRGRIRLGGQDLTFRPTDARRFSTRGDGLADGFVARFGLDVLDPLVGNLTMMPHGLSVAEAFNATRERCDTLKQPCDWGKRLDKGPLVDPRSWDSLGDGAADAWEYRDGDDRTHPLTDSRDVLVDDTRAWDAKPWERDPDGLFGVVVDDANARPSDPFVLTAVDAYRYLRPDSWDEAADGPWPHGLNGTVRPGGGSLPAAVALRGWSLGVDVGLGGAHDLRQRNATADPRRTDSDGDGLADAAEYFGILPDGRAMNRTDPADPDTDADGLMDSLEGPAGYGTDPTRRDTAGSFLGDEAKVALWRGKYEAAAKAFLEDPQAARIEYAWLADASGAIDFERLRPEGKLRGEVANVLSADVDGDGMKDGQELFPDQFLDSSSSNARPATDPARVDSDGDLLPDAWEVGWSKDAYYQCRSTCRSGATVPGWPLDPMDAKSVETEDDVTDFEINLSGDALAKPQRTSSSGLAYAYDLNPYSQDSNEDGIPNLFSIHWGIEHVDPVIVALIEDDLETAAPKYKWADDARRRMVDDMASRPVPGVPNPSAPVVIEPGRRPSDPADPCADPICLDRDLLSVFGLPAKGVWHFVASACAKTVLPGTDARGPLDGCWAWSPYPLSKDVAQATNPWSHDSDGDGLPDAWELLYGVTDRVASSPTDTSVGSGCQTDSKTAGLGDGDHCLSYLDAYLNGLNPLVADTDGGSTEDWYELALGRLTGAPLNPRDLGDDLGELDWDGDLVRNRDETGTSRMDPDSDHDGLADGGDLQLTGVRGDLCLATAGNTPLASTAGRPGGALTQAQLYATFAASGLLRDAKSANGCGAGKVRFYSEGVRDPLDQKFYGAGGGTDPTKWSTMADGLPDGWKAYYRDHSSLSGNPHPLDPLFRVPATQDLDGDLLFTAGEYGAGRPADWKEDLDGVWWGGFDPTSVDSDGDNNWYRVTTDGDDGSDPDLDNDGLAADDPNPFHLFGISPISRQAFGGRYIVDAEAVFSALQVRQDQREARTAGTVDRDGDLVPDSIDRARIAVAARMPDGLSIIKGKQFVVEGEVTVAEQPATGLAPADYTAAPHADDPSAGSGAGVAGATVKAYLATGDTQGLVGVAFTRADGSFTMVARAAPTVFGSTVPTGGASVEGQFFVGGDTPVLASTAGALQPGPASLLVVVEANDLTLQELRFLDGASLRDGAEAFKDMAGSGDEARYLPPGSERGLRSVILDPAAGATPARPREPSPSVRHVADGVFETRASVEDLLLRSVASLSVQLPSPLPLVGDKLVVKGVLTDDQGPLTERTVHLTLGQSGTPSSTAHPVTDSEGRFEAELATMGLRAEVARLSAFAEVGPGVVPPDPNPALFDVPLRMESTWDGVAVNGFSLSPVAVPAGTPFTATGLLVDHLGNGLGNRPATVTLADGSRQLEQASVTTGPDGRVSVQLSIQPTAPDKALDVLMHVQPNPQETHVPGGIVVRARFPTTLALAEATLAAGKAGNLTGTLTRYGGQPVSLVGATFSVVGPDGVADTRTGDVVGGAVRLAMPAGPHSVERWQARFVGTDTLDPSSLGAADVVRRANSILALDAPVALAGKPVTVTGRLLGDALGVVGNVTVRWADRPSESATVLTDVQTYRGDGKGDGLFAALLPARKEPGEATMEASFAGTRTLAAASARRAVQVQAASAIEAANQTVVVAPDGQLDGPLVQGRLLGDDGQPRPGRTLTLSVTAPNGLNRIVAATADNDGRFQLGAADMRLANGTSLLSFEGPLRVHIDSKGNALERPASLNVSIALRHRMQVEVARLPAAGAVGQPFEVQGRIATFLRGPLPAGLVLSIDGQEAATLQTATTVPWTLVLELPRMPRGTYPLTLAAFTYYPPYQDIEPLHADLVVQSPLDVTYTEVEHEDGSRRVDVVATSDDGTSLDGLKLVLVRRDDDEAFLGERKLTLDAQGKASIVLEAGELGALRLAMRRDPSIYLGQTTHQIDPFEHRLVGEGGPSLLLAIAGAVTFVLLAACVAGYLAWRRRHSSALSAAVAASHRLVLDPGIPIREAVQRVYRHFLAVLEQAGYRRSEAETVRDIAERATAAFALPQEPMRSLTKLFETATYSKAPMQANDRRTALRSLGDLGQHLGMPLGGSP